MKKLLLCFALISVTLAASDRLVVQAQEMLNCEKKFTEKHILLNQCKAARGAKSKIEEHLAKYNVAKKAVDKKGIAEKEKVVSINKTLLEFLIQFSNEKGKFESSDLDSTKSLVNWLFYPSENCDETICKEYREVALGYLQSNGVALSNPPKYNKPFKQAQIEQSTIKVSSSAIPNIECSLVQAAWNSVETQAGNQPIRTNAFARGLAEKVLNGLLQQPDNQCFINLPTTDWYNRTIKNGWFAHLIWDGKNTDAQNSSLKAEQLPKVILASYKFAAGYTPETAGAENSLNVIFNLSNAAAKRSEVQQACIQAKTIFSKLYGRYLGFTDDQFSGSQIGPIFTSLNDQVGAQMFAYYTIFPTSTLECRRIPPKE